MNRQLLARTLLLAAGAFSGRAAGASMSGAGTYGNGNIYYRSPPLPTAPVDFKQLYFNDTKLGVLQASASGSDNNGILQNVAEVLSGSSSAEVGA